MRIHSGSWDLVRVKERLSGVEQAIFGAARNRSDVERWLAQLVSARLHATVAREVRRAGRIGAVYVLELTDGRTVVAKVHRSGTDISGLRAAQRCQRRLFESGYPCPAPLDEAAMTGGHLAALETYLPAGRRGDGRATPVRAALAAGLALQIALLRDAAPDVAVQPPAWARWRDGPWPVPHDPIFDFTTTEPRWRWLDEYAGQASAELGLLQQELGRPVLGHADWSCVNTTFTADLTSIASSYDWDSLTRDSEPVLVGMSAGSYLQGGTTSPDCPTPDEVVAYLDSYDHARGRPFTPVERRAAHAAARWVLAYNARCEAALTRPDDEPAEHSTLAALLDRREHYRSA